MWHLKSQLFVLCHIKSTCLWMTFVPIMHWSLEKYLFTELFLSSKCWNISLYSKKENKILNITTTFIRKILRLRSCKLMVADTSFQKCNFYLKACILSLATKTYCFPLSDKLTLLIFERVSNKCPSMNQFVNHSFR